MVKPRKFIERETKAIHIELDFPLPKLLRWDGGNYYPTYEGRGVVMAFGHVL